MKTRKTGWIMIAAVCVLSAADVPYAGRWKLNPAKSNDPGAAKTIEFAQRGADGLTVKILDVNATCEAKFDGKDYPAAGATVPPGYTLAVRKIDGQSFEMVQKISGKTLYTTAFTVSTDGKTLTETNANEKTHAVYDRQ